MSNRLFLIAAALLLFPGVAQAYVGPGAGLGAVAITFATLFGVFLLLAGFVWYPLKRLVRRFRTPSANQPITKD